MLALIRNKKSEVQERVRVLVQSRPAFPQSLSVLGMLLIAPGLFTVGALLPHSDMSQVSGLNLNVRYTPTNRINEPTLIVLSTMSVFGTKGQFSIRVGKNITENFSISNISPEPLRERLDGNQTVYVFSGGGNNAVTFTLIPKIVGRTAATLQYGLDPPIAFSLSTLP